MALYCPFCHAPEDERLEAIDERGNSILLVMFDCPFHFRFPLGEFRSDEAMQARLDSWRKEEGESWFESVGPVMKARELRNVERYKSSLEN